MHAAGVYRHRRAVRSEAGQSALEFLAVLAVAAAVLVLLANLGLVQRATDAARLAACRLTGSACPGGPGGPAAQSAFEPGPCQRSSRDSEDLGSVKVAFFKLGGNFGFSRTTKADGETSFTFVDGAGAALVAGAGAKLEVTKGATTYGGRLAADGELGASVSRGDTWVFRTPREADGFESWIRRERNEDRRGGVFPPYAGVNWVVETVSGERDIPKPDITFTEAEGAAETSASAQFGPVGGEVKANAAALLGVERDRRNGRTARYYQVDFGVAGKASYIAAGLGAGWEGSGVVKVTRDRTGDIVELEIVDTSTGTLDGLLELDTDRLTYNELMTKLAKDAQASFGADGSRTRSIVSTTTLAVDNAADRAVVERWAGFLSGVATAGERAADGGLPDNEGAARSPMGRLLFDKSTVSVVEYDGRRSGLSFAAEVALGPKLGVELGTTDESSEAVRAMYLGAPSGGRRVLVPFTACVPG